MTAFVNQRPIHQQNLAAFMTTRSTFPKPSHVSDRAWALAQRMTLRQLAGQLTSIDAGRYQQLAGEDIALASRAATSAPQVWSATGLGSCRRSRSRTDIRRSW
jgi:hypothetical protein